MNELITVNYDNDRPTVLGRDLHEKLGIKTAYKDWFPRMCEYGFDENVDYVLVAQKRATNNPKNPETTVKDHQLTLDMAKQICMIQRSDLGRQYREYFLEIERRWNDPVTSMARSLVYANRQLASVTGQLEEAKRGLDEANRRIGKLEPKAAYYDTVANADGSTSFRETAKLFKVGEKKFTAFIEQSKLCYRDIHKRLIPYAERQKSGWFEVKEVTITTSEGVKTTLYTKITPKGRTEIFRRMQTAGLIPMTEGEVMA